MTENKPLNKQDVLIAKNQETKEWEKMVSEKSFRSAVEGHTNDMLELLDRYAGNEISVEELVIGCALLKLKWFPVFKEGEVERK